MSAPPTDPVLPRGVRVGSTSWRWRPRPLVVVALGAVALVLVAALNVGRGEYPIPLAEVLRALVGAGEGASSFIVVELRLPRTLVGALVGAALGLSGAITQGVSGNPLASPDILGVTDGASVFAVALLVLGGSGGAVGLLAVLGIPGAALAGGLLAALLVYVLAYRQGLDSVRLLLVGIGISTAGVSLTSWLLVVANIQQAGQVLVWLRGSLNARGWEHVVPVAVVLLIAAPIAVRLAFRLSALELGDDTAAGLGVPVNRVRVALVGLAVVLAAAATAVAGPVRFVALVSPQIAQRLTGGSRPPLAAAAVYGALVVVAADLVARVVLPGELPVGIVTVVLGAPYLLWLLVRRTRRASV